MSKLIHSDPSHCQSVFLFYKVISTFCKSTFSWFPLSVYKHSSKHSTGSIHKYTISIPTLSVIRLKSTQAVPFTCTLENHIIQSVFERAQVTPLIGPPLLFGPEPSLILRFDVLTEMYKNKYKIKE